MQNRLSSYVRVTNYPIISLTMSMIRRSLKMGTTYSCGMGYGFSTTYCSFGLVATINTDPPCGDRDVATPYYLG